MEGLDNTNPVREGKDSRKLFLRNAFYLLAHRKQILSNSRMSLAPVGVGAIPLGAYLEWWTEGRQAVRMNDEGRLSLVFQLAGSPFSGTNSCTEIYEDGTIKNCKIHSFSRSYGLFRKICRKYEDSQPCPQVFTISEVVSTLKAGDVGEMNIHWEVLPLFLQRRIEFLEREAEISKESYHELYIRHINTLLRWKETEVRTLYFEYTKRATKIHAEIDNVRAERSQLKQSLKSGKIESRDYQSLVSKIKKVICELENELYRYAYQELRRIFPEEYVSIEYIEDYIKSTKQQISNKE